MTLDEYETLTSAAKRTGFAAVTLRLMCTRGEVPDAYFFAPSFWVVPKDWTPTRRSPGRKPHSRHGERTTATR